MTKKHIRFCLDARIPARDGIELSADIYLPSTPGRFPSIVTRTPYDNANADIVPTAEFFARAGYAFVSCDVRGRGDSDGRFRPFRGEGPDGYDTVEWVAAQDWSNGDVGMMGASYACSTQWWAARERPPHLKALVSTAVSGRLVQSHHLRGKAHPSFLLWLHRVAGHTMQPGVPPDEFSPSIDWTEVLLHRPVREADRAMGRPGTAWQEWIANASDGSYWASDSHFQDYERIDLPVLHITGWYDGSLVGELEIYEQMLRFSPAAARQYLLVGPWNHGGTRRPLAQLGPLRFGDAAILDMDAVHLRWFDHWLRSSPDPEISGGPWVKIFTMGTNRWRDLRCWPPQGFKAHILYFHSAGSANSRAGDGSLDTAEPSRERSDSYRYDPRDATPSAPDLETFLTNSGPLDNLDREFVESRDDVLVYTSAPLERDMEVTGVPVVRLWAQSDASDTDFAAALSDVDAAGRSIILAEGLIRTSYREGLGPSGPIFPNKPVMFTLDLNPTSVVLKAGHRVRVSIMSAEFPAYSRNPNTGAPLGDDQEMTVATQTVLHRRGQASQIELPVADL